MGASNNNQLSLQFRKKIFLQNSFLINDVKNQVLLSKEQANQCYVIVLERNSSVHMRETSRKGKLGIITVIIML